MPGEQPFVVADDGAGGTIGTTYAANRVIALTSGTSVDAAARDNFPSAGFISHVELGFSATASSPTTVRGFLAWDAEGDYPATDESSWATLITGLTTATRRGTAIQCDIWYVQPSASTAGTIYLFLRTDVGTVTLDRARLYGHR